MKEKALKKLDSMPEKVLRRELNDHTMEAELSADCSKKLPKSIRIYRRRLKAICRRKGIQSLIQEGKDWDAKCRENMVNEKKESDYEYYVDSPYDWEEYDELMMAEMERCVVNGDYQGARYILYRIEEEDQKSAGLIELRTILLKILESENQKREWN